ncbi:MAG: hypothetical protein CVV12_10195 [Gammaproteobacteria bacterium HGW-Gammaproteobacteria-2]|nr:MAG: hypothetical protein CVV12_10195 [Gammaproteobacteria bacterium HGW-Gammaproteobacteria-2]
MVANIEKSRGRIVTAEQVELRRSCLSVACAIALYAGGAGAQESSVALTSGAAAVAAGAQTIGAAQDEADDTAQLDAVGKKAKSKARKDDRDANATTLDEVRVTGIRHSVAKSLELKRESNSIVEVISAEDIGKLPDTSIAESLARVPGLAAQRTDGRAQQIAIRGLSPDFAGTLLNGREQTSAGDNRGVEFDQYPSELINGVTIYKTPDALLIGQGLSGTVDLHTISPLAVGERRVVVNARGENTSFGKLNDGSDSTGFRASASYIDQFADDTIGVAIGYAHLDSPFQEKHYKAWWWGDTGAFGAPIAGQPADTVALMGAEAWARSRDQVRDGVMAVLEFQPNDDLHSQIDLFYSHFDQKEIMRGLMWSQDPWTGNNVFVTGAQTTPFGGVDVVTGGTINNIEPIVRNDSNRRKDDIYSAGWNTTYKFTEGPNARSPIWRPQPGWQACPRLVSICRWVPVSRPLMSVAPTSPTHPPCCSAIPQAGAATGAWKTRSRTMKSRRRASPCAATSWKGRSAASISATTTPSATRRKPRPFSLPTCSMVALRLR